MGTEVLPAFGPRPGPSGASLEAVLPDRYRLFAEALGRSLRLDLASYEQAARRPRVGRGRKWGSLEEPAVGGPVLALFATELACAAAWALTGGVWYCLGAMLCGAALVFVVLFGRR